MKTRSTHLVLAAATALSVTLLAGAGVVYSYSVEALVLRDITVVADMGLVKSIDAVTVNGNGDWLVEIDTDFADTDTDGAVIGGAGIFAREGDALPATGGSLGSFDSVVLNDSGSVGWNLFLDGVSGSTDSGIFFDTTLILQEGTHSTAPQLSARTPYIGFFDVRMNNGNNLFVIASVDDPAITSSVDRALVWFDYDSGAMTFTETVLAKEGDVLPGVAFPAADFGTSQENYDINNAGQALYTVSLSGAPTASNGALYLDQTLLALKGDPSPAGGLIYSNIGTSTRVGLNDNGDWVMVTGLSGDASTNQIIVKNGQKVIQKGDPAPGLLGRTITGFGSAPVRIAEDGSVFYYASLDGDTATNQGIWRGTQLILQKGVATQDSFTFSTLAGTTAAGGIGEGFSISTDGRYLIVRAVLDTGTIGAFLVSFECPTFADLNCDGIVNGADLGLLLGSWDLNDPSADLNNDDIVDGADLGLLLSAWTVI